MKRIKKKEEVTPSAKLQDDLLSYFIRVVQLTVDQSGKHLGAPKKLGTHAKS